MNTDSRVLLNGLIRTVGAGVRSMDDPLDMWSESLAAQRVLSSAADVSVPCFVSGPKYLCPSVVNLNVRLFPFFLKRKSRKNVRQTDYFNFEGHTRRK